MRSRRYVPLTLALLALLTVVVVAGCSPAPPPTESTTPPPASTEATSAPGAGGATVVMKDTAFDNTRVTIKVGETVTFKNDDTTQHNIEVNGQQSGVMEPGGEWTTPKFESPGNFRFTCTIHPSMNGTLEVQQP